MAEAAVESPRRAVTAKSLVISLALVLLWTVGACTIAVNEHVYKQQFLMIVGFGAILTILLVQFPRFFLATGLLVFAGTWALSFINATPEDYPRLKVGLVASIPPAAVLLGLAAWLIRRPANRAELAVIYACVVIAIPWCVCIKSTLESSVGNLFSLQQRAEPKLYDWAKDMPWWGPTIPTGPEQAPSDEMVSAVNGFAHGNGGNVPWRLWWRPMVYWTGTCLAYEAMLMGLLLMFRRRWIEHERLPFVWAYPAMQVIGVDEPYRPSRQHWILFGIGLAICLPGILLVGPSGEALYGWTVPPWAGSAEGLRGGFDLTGLNILPNVPVRLFWGPLVVTIFLLFPVDILMTVAITYVVTNMVIPQAMYSMGFQVGPVRMVEAVKWGIRFGGGVGILFWSAWYLAWDYVKARRAGGGGGMAPEGRGGIGKGWVALLTGGGFAAFVALGCYGSNLAQMLIMTGFLLVFAFTQVRQRVEGMPFTSESNIVSHTMTSLQRDVLGQHYTHVVDEGVPMAVAGQSWATHWLQWAFAGQLKAYGPHNMLLEAFKIGHEVKVHARTIALAVLVTMLIVAAVTPGLYVKLMYTYGFENSFQSEFSINGSFTQWSERSASYGVHSTSQVFYMTGETFYDKYRNDISALAGWALIGLLFYLRREYPRFIINPVGVVIGAEYFIEGAPLSPDWTWFSFLIVGIAKALTFRWVGVRSFRQKVQPAAIMLLCGMIYGIMLFLFRQLSVGSGFLK